MSIYRVEKSELPVVIFQADGSVMKGVVFLSATAYSHMGQQTLLDLMKEEGNFFPFRSDAGGFCVANKNTITHIRFAPSEVDPEQNTNHWVTKRMSISNLSAASSLSVR